MNRRPTCESAEPPRSGLIEPGRTGPSFRLLPAPKGGGFAQPDYWVWCGSAIRGEDGRYHLFASRWPKKYPFYNGYAYHSEIVRAVADGPLGPFVFQERVLGHRDLSYWDGGRNHNPTIHKIAGTYCLFYEAVTFPKGMPSDEEISSRPPHEGGTYPAIGVATAPSVFGPWKRRDEPILAQRTGCWDREVVTNPAVCVTPGGRVRLYYRSYDLAIGVAEADRPEGPYRRLGTGPIKVFIRPNGIEDMFVWHNGDCFEMIAKDLSHGATLTGEFGSGVHATSKDGLAWRVSDQPKAYSRTILWDDGTNETLGCLERPQLLMESGVPRVLYAAAGDGPGGFNACARTWNVAIPLAPAMRDGEEVADGGN